MDACPHCGGKNGYQTAGTMSFTRWHTWDGDTVDTQIAIKTEGLQRCWDCGKSVRAALNRVASPPTHNLKGTA
jgi:hypothetical protein